MSSKTFGERIADKWWPGGCPTDADIKEALAELIDSEAAKNEQPDNNIEARIAWSKEHSTSRQPVQYAEEVARDVIEGIWNNWYGEHRGNMDAEHMSAVLEKAKQKIINAARSVDAEMERVKACEHIAEGDMEGNDWRILRNICPSTAAVATLRDKYEELLKRESSWQPIETAPKDGSKIIAFAKDIYGEAQQINTTYWNAQHDGSGCWVRFSTHFPPTHWMPLPKPPTDTEDGSR